MKAISITSKFLFAQVFRLLRNPNARLRLPQEVLSTSASAPVYSFTPGKGQLLKWLLKYNGKPMIIFGVLKIIWAIFTWTATYWVFLGLLSLGSKKTFIVNDFYVLCVLLFICCLGATGAYHYMNYLSFKHSVRVRSALTSLVYAKLLKMRASESITDTVTIIATDVPSVAQGVQSFHILWTAPFEVLTIFILGSCLVGYAVLPAVGMLLIFLPINAWIGMDVAKTISKVTKVTLDRVQKVVEVLPVMKLIKFYVWESHFQGEIEKDRKVEESLMLRKLILRACNYTAVFVFPVFTVWITLWTFQLTGGAIDPIISFTCLNLFNSLRYPLLLLPNAITDFAGALKGIESIERFLDLKEVDPPTNLDTHQDHDILIENAEFTWTGKDKLLIEDLKIKHGTLVAIVGDVGAGKSSLLAAISGEMRLVSGQRNITTSISLCPQEAWLLKETIKKNILLGAPFSAKRLDQVVHSCGLKTDLEMFQDGQDMLVLEGGSNLSGGQRQRVSLARSVYANSDMILLDDPLSALDQKVGKHIFDECIKKFLRKRTILLSTNNLNQVNDVDYVILMKNGQIACHGPTSECTNHPEFQTFYNQHSGMNFQYESTEDTSDPIHNELAYHGGHSVQLTTRSAMAGSYGFNGQTWKSVTTSMANDEVVEQDEDELVLVNNNEDKQSIKSGDAIGFYLGNRRIRMLFAALVCVFFFTHAIRLVSDYWVKLWGSKTINPLNISKNEYALYYLIFMCAFGTMVFTRGYLFSLFTSYKSRTIHQDGLNRVFNATMQYLEVNPIGITIGAFSKDIYSLDDEMPENFFKVLQFLPLSLGGLLMTLIFIPMTWIISIIAVIGAVGIQVVTKRLYDVLLNKELATRPEIYTHLNTTVDGISCVRIFKATTQFTHSLYRIMDGNHSYVLGLGLLESFRGFYVDIIVSLYIFTAAIFSNVFQVDPSNLGLALSNALQLLVFLQWTVKGLSDGLLGLQAGQSFMFIRDNAKPEDGTSNGDDADSLDDSKKRIDKGVEFTGRIEYNDFWLKYEENADPILKGISFDVKAGEKVGVVGRTGAGKSTIISSLFRIVDGFRGAIKLDEHNIKDLSLKLLRNSIAIIPQEPVTFTTTLRYNLDPLNQFTEQDLWRVLERMNLMTKINTFDDKLDTILTNQLSAGEKQLLCIARAVLSECRIVVLDEATSRIDAKSDRHIQQVIRDMFGDKTVVTIAHRLDTIIDSDRVLVMDAGLVVEYGVPSELLDKKDGVFRQLVDSSTHPEQLEKLAREAYAKMKK
eukprot:NODE_333_length_10741_cov_0.423135.p1 type:complete len:1269 gc:universal NODE_333_length_10741_cov_0.423135:3321-7127(+)